MDLLGDRLQQPSSLIGVWKLISATEDALLVVTARHLAAVFARATTRRGVVGTYTQEPTPEGLRLRLTAQVDTAVPALDAELDVQVDGDRMTWTFVQPGRVSPAGRAERWHRIE